jgi:molybdopterin-biosynthesis enzyme MoeA-like protein
MKAPRFGLYIIGDEILSGKRQDKHLSKVIELLGARGLRLSWSHYLGDDRDFITASLARSFNSDDVVFSCGGIGSTPDDHTRQAAALALGVALELHPEARELIAQRCADMALERRGSADMTTPENQQRLKMGEFPRGARILPNAYNRIPGFAVGRHYFVPGFPVMAWPMIESVLDTEYGWAFGSGRIEERSLLVFETPESAIVPLMVDIEARFPEVKAFSLPSVGDGSDGKAARRHIELGVKGPAHSVDSAFAAMFEGIRAIGAEFEQT